MSNKNISPLELYIKAYFRGTAKKLINKDFVRKALALVDEHLGTPCCSDPDATIDLHTRFDNDLTNTVRMTLVSFPKKGNVQALNRIHKLLYTFLNPPCCA